MYQLLFDNGALLNASIKEDANVSALWYSFAEIKDFELTQDLMQRGCKINSEEVGKLSQLYVDFATQDSVYIDNDNFKEYLMNRMKGRRMLKSLVNRGLQFLNANIFSNTLAAAKTHEDKKNNGGKRKKNKDNSKNGKDVKQAYKMEIILNVLASNLLHRALVMDMNKNNPLHLFMLNPIISPNSGVEDQDIGGRMAEEQKIVRLLKNEVCVFCAK